jgi:hypothetical protein
MKTRKNQDRNFRFLLFTAIFMLLGLAFMACDRDKDKVGSTNVMAVHASADAAPASFFLGGTKISTGALAYGEATSYISTPSGSRKAEFKGADNSIIGSADVNLAEKKNYTIFLAGTVAAPAVVVVQDDLTAPAADKAKVRIINLSTDDTAVDIKLAGGEKLATNLTYKAVSNYLAVSPGIVTYEVLKNADDSLIFTMPQFTLAAGKIYTIWIKGAANGVGNAEYGAKLITQN